MKKLITVVVAAGLALAGMAGETAKFLEYRQPKGAEIVPGKIFRDFSTAKNYCTENKIPFVAIWSNGDKCSHCTKFENVLRHSTFRTWLKNSGCVFFFTYPGDGSAGKAGTSTFHWIRNDVNVDYPFVRIYWPAGGVDVATVGDVIDQRLNGADGGADKAVAYFKKILKDYDPKPVDPALPYTIAFDANFPTTKGTDGAMEIIDALYGTATNLTDNAFVCSNYTFSGWAKSATGSVAYKNGASVKGLTSVSNKVVTLYARWTKTTYGPYYTGVKKTIKVTTYTGALYAGYKPASKISGLTWNTKGYWTGTPTKAGTYTITFKKSSSSIKRTFVIVKDAVALADMEIGSDGSVDTDTSTLFDSAVAAVSGAMTSVKVTGLPDGLKYKDGKIVGRVTTPGTYSVTISGKTKNSQTVKRTIVLEVVEGNAILLNGLAHADEIWAQAGEEISYPLVLKIKNPDDTYQLEPVTDAEVSVQDAFTGEDVIDVVSVDDGRLVIAQGATGVFEVTIGVTVDEQPVVTEFTLNLLESSVNQD